jgi:hydroxylaminobenzene mutase
VTVTNTPDRVLIRAGFLLFTFAMLTGFAIPEFLNQKMALAAHVTGALNALVLMALGLAWGLLAVGPRQGQLTRAAFIFATYANWSASCLAAAWGTSRLTPISGSGYAGTPWQELVVQGLQVSLSLAIVAGAISVIHGLRPSAVAR